uniref:Uncharacterized protein n=1 Tax=Biomphalaria glabrata TaxID=6526 RepID=A0A2C9KS92_BIOGL
METKNFNTSKFVEHENVHISSGKFFAALIKKIPTQSDAQVYKCLVVGETFIISEKKVVKYNAMIKLNKTNLGNADLVMDFKPSIINFGFTPQLVVNCSLTINTVLERVYSTISLYRYNVTQKEFDLLLTMDTKTMNVKQTVEHKDVHISSGSMFAALIKVNPTQSDAQVYKCLVGGEGFIFLEKKLAKYFPTIKLNKTQHMNKSTKDTLFNDTSKRNIIPFCFTWKQSDGEERLGDWFFAEEVQNDENTKGFGEIQMILDGRLTRDARK